MAQERKLVFGALIETEDLPVAISNIMSPGRLKGMDFAVGAADLLQISPGSCLLPDGVIILEDATKQLLVNNSSFPADYTVIYQLEDSRVLGGSPGILRILPGILRQDDFTDACVLGWIKYPGGSIPLADTHFVQPARIRVENTQGTLSDVFTPPFTTAIRPSQQVPGSNTLRSTRVVNLSSSLSQTMSFGGIAARILSATATSDSVAIPANDSNYNAFSIKKIITTSGMTGTGSNILTAVTDVTLVSIGQAVTGTNIPSGSTVVSISGTSVTISGIATGTSITPVTLTFSDNLLTCNTRSAFQGEINPNTPKSFVKVSGIPVSKFVVQPNQVIRLENTPVGSPPAAAGEFNIVAEIPASSGDWLESQLVINNEYTQRFLNISTETLTYNIRQPFVITGTGQPRKLITRLNVDFNCIVTFKIYVDSQLITLEPVSGTVANTGGLITREFNIPTTASVNWVAGNTAAIDISIQAQPGGSASFAHISLTQEGSPFLLFI